MSIISSIKTYMKTYSGLASGAPVWVDYLGAVPTEYSIAPLAGNRVLEKYLDGSALKEYPFAFRSVESTAAELERLENSGFFETFADWLDSQTETGVFPSLSAGKTVELIEATGWGYLFQEGNSETGIYQIQCRLVYLEE